MAIDNVSFSNLVTQSILNSQQSSTANINSGQISTEDFENVLTQYLTSYTNQNSKKSRPLATALGADESLIEELLTSSAGRKAITQMTSNHLMNVVTSSNVTKSSGNEDNIKTILKESTSDFKENDSETKTSTDTLVDAFTSLADILKTANQKVNSN